MVTLFHYFQYGLENMCDGWEANNYDSRQPTVIKSCIQSISLIVLM